MLQKNGVVVGNNKRCVSDAQLPAGDKFHFFFHTKRRQGRGRTTCQGDYTPKVPVEK